MAIPEDFLEVSARLGAKHVLVMSAEASDARTVERFCDPCDRAAPYGLHVGLEFAVYTGVRTLAHAAHIIAQAKRPNASVLIDALHFSRSGGLPAHVAQVDPSLFRYAASATTPTRRPPSPTCPRRSPRCRSSVTKRG